MSVIAEAVRHMMKAGMDADAIADAVAAMEAATPKTRTVGAIRQERYRRNKASQSVTSDDSDDALSPKKENTPTPPKEKTTPIPISPLVGARAQFIEFWNLFPNKVGKRDAEREFNLALQRSSFDEIMAGLRRYVDKTDDRPWCNPSTFLHQNRWEDQPVSITRRQNGHSPPERSVSDVLGEMAAGTWTGPKDTTPNEPFIETSFTRRN